MGSGVHMGKEAKAKRFVKIILDVGHKMGAEWDEKLSRDAAKWVPNGTKNCPGKLYLSS